MKRDTTILSVFFLLIIITAIFDTFVNIHSNPQAGDRAFAIYTQALILAISLLYLFNNYNVKSIHITSFHNALLSFMLMLTVYGIFSENVQKLPVCLFSVSSFYIFYYAAYKGLINFKHIQYFAIILLIIYFYQTYLGFIYRSTHWANFFVKADNTGYRALYLMLLFALFINNLKSFLLFSLAFLLVIVSLKRGAILIGVLIYLIGTWSILIGKIKIKKRVLLILRIGVIIIISGFFYLAINNWDIISYRFVSDSSGGSGRESIYSTIYNGWRQGNIGNILFGFGFYQVSDLLSGGGAGDILTYAHSDLQLIYDHGLLGIAIYFILFMSFIKNRKLIKKYSPDYYHLFLMTAFTWLLKSIYSGVYMNKDSIILFMIIGIILGTAFREKHKQIQYKRTTSQHS